MASIFGAPVIEPLIRSLDRSDVRVIPVRNEFFGGNTGVTGLMTGEDIARTLAAQPHGHRFGKKRHRPDRDRKKRQVHVPVKSRVYVIRRFAGDDRCGGFAVDWEVVA